MDSLPTPRARPTSRGRIARWGITLVATLVATWALDLVAAVSGVALLATGIADHAPRSAVVALLAVSYGVWTAGLIVNLGANWRLLERTGTSTNVLSKAAYEIAGARSMRRRAVRHAADGGYVATELLKEAPYYAGAFGAAMFSDGIDAAHALVFLAGANLGAAVYEGGVGALTGAILTDRAARSRGGAAALYASFEEDWQPVRYLEEYYASVQPDERATIRFFVDACRRAPVGGPTLLFGVGPTLHHVFLAARTASEIHLAEYLPANLQAVRSWLRADPDAHDWRPFVRYTLQCEGVSDPSAADIAARERLTRSKVTALLLGDARLDDPLSGCGRPAYPTVISAYCADSATADTTTWATYMRNITSLVQPAGLFLTAALRDCRGYEVGGRLFPSASVDERDVARVLSADFELDGDSVVAHHLTDQPEHGYSSIVLARATRRPARS